MFLECFRSSRPIRIAQGHQVVAGSKRIHIGLSHPSNADGCDVDPVVRCVLSKKGSWQKVASKSRGSAEL
ncbi:hypothetical protein SDC9_181059 [bioreactor metagenome]|uniref:Uncharacterized protein n=1 Tax=bioreactor metagenome TaxID=1076179 RepID=A0A645H4G0_9ZZZZ